MRLRARGLLLQSKFPIRIFSASGARVGGGQTVVSGRICGLKFHCFFQRSNGLRILLLGEERHAQPEVGIGEVGLELGGLGEMLVPLRVDPGLAAPVPPGRIPHRHSRDRFRVPVAALSWPARRSPTVDLAWRAAAAPGESECPDSADFVPESCDSLSPPDPICPAARSRPRPFRAQEWKLEPM